MSDRTSATRAPRTYPAPDPMMDEMLRRVRASDAARTASARPAPVPASRPADSLMDEALRRVRAGR